MHALHVGQARVQLGKCAILFFVMALVVDPALGSKKRPLSQPVPDRMGDPEPIRLSDIFEIDQDLPDDLPVADEGSNPCQGAQKVMKDMMIVEQVGPRRLETGRLVHHVSVKASYPPEPSCTSQVRSNKVIGFVTDHEQGPEKLSLAQSSSKGTAMEVTNIVIYMIPELVPVKAEYTEQFEEKTRMAQDLIRQDLLQLQEEFDLASQVPDLDSLQSNGWEIMKRALTLFMELIGSACNIIGLIKDGMQVVHVLTPLVPAPHLYGVLTILEHVCHGHFVVDSVLGWFLDVRKRAAKTEGSKDDITGFVHVMLTDLRSLGGMLGKASEETGNPVIIASGQRFGMNVKIVSRILNTIALVVHLVKTIPVIHELIKFTAFACILHAGVPIAVIGATAGACGLIATAINVYYANGKSTKISLEEVELSYSVFKLEQDLNMMLNDARGVDQEFGPLHIQSTNDLGGHFRVKPHYHLH